ncbi:MAG: NepR family anti-sigma factor [Altererythrobacter sp.]
MAPQDKPEKQGKSTAKVSATKDRKPGWASGLQQLYDSVVHEPLPESFKDLLSRLDDAD